jgi:hypothetical protein
MTGNHAALDQGYIWQLPATHDLFGGQRLLHELQLS